MKKEIEDISILFRKGKNKDTSFKKSLPVKRMLLIARRESLSIINWLLICILIFYNNQKFLIIHFKKFFSINDLSYQ